MFPLVTDLPKSEESSLDSEEAWLAGDLEQTEDLEGKSDPSKWGVPRAFFVVHAQAENPVDSNVAC